MPGTQVAVVVCTKTKEVLFGYTDDPMADVLVLERARMCVMWTSDVKGVLGLASEGPSKECRITNPIISITIKEPTLVMTASSTAAARWEAGPWK